MKKLFTLMSAALMVAMLFTGCSSQSKVTKPNTVTSSSADKTNTDKSNSESVDTTSGKLPDLGVSFGPNSNAFTLHLDNNNTAAEIARYIGKANWNLPIYHFNDFENYEVMQYYDIPSSYKITSDPKTVTSEKAGEVYYSAPNRIVLFYQDAKVEGKFTRVGQLVNTDGLKEAVEKNPVVQGWGNKIITVSPAK